jgi:hypothetical protein
VTRALVVAASFLGLLVPLWTIGFYPAGDVFSRVLIGLIVLGLFVGFVELWRRAHTVDGLARELGLLDGEASELEQRLQTGSERFRRLVSARLRGATALLDGTVFTPYLVSVLVLVGLLGTFVGLVETLAGARDALSSSAEIDSLRAALLAPMRGLSRAFGTSVAGVSASAMLGLAAAFVRRSEGRFFAVLNGSVSSSLSSQTLVARQVAALERLGQQGDALPRAVDGLAQVAARLPALEDSLVDGNKELSRAVREAIEASAKEVSQTLARGIDSATKAHEELVDKVLDRAAKLLEERVQRLTTTLDEDLGARRQAEERQQKALEERSSDALVAFGKGLERLLAVEEERASQLRSLVEERAQRDAARDEQVQQVLEQAAALSREAAALAADQVGRLGGFLSEVRSAGQEQAETLRAEVQRWLEEEASRGGAREEQLAALDERLARSREASEESARATFAGLAARVEELALHLGELGDGQLERLGELEARLEEDRKRVTAEIAEKLSSQAGEMAEEIGGAVSALRGGADSLGAGGVELLALADRFSIAVDGYKGASELWIDKLTTLEVVLSQSGRGEDERERFGVYLDQTREVFDRSLELQRELFAGLKTVQREAPAAATVDDDTGAAA